MNQAHILNTISHMIKRYIPGSVEEKQLVHLIDANLYMKHNKCTLTEALRATAKKHPGMASDGDIRLEHLKRAYDYKENRDCTITEALQRTAPTKAIDADSLIIAEQLDHIERARKYQEENDCSFDEALSITAPRSN